MDRCLLLVFSAQFLVISFLETWGIYPSWKQFTGIVLAKKWYACWDFGFVGNKMAFTIGKLTEIKSHFITYKSNANTTYLNTKLIKTVTVNVYKSDGNRLYSYEMVNVIKDSGEGRCFL